MRAFIAPLPRFATRAARHAVTTTTTTTTRPHPAPTRPASRLFRTAFAGTAVAAVTFVAAAHFRPSSRPLSDAAPAMSLTALQNLKDIDGKAIDSSVFAGKVVFAMNVASACGYTKPGYDLFKRLTDKYSTDDFVAVAIPCNSFGWQENGSPEEIKTFALAKADKLLITERSVVNGKNPHPIINIAKEKFPGRIMWNFDGRFVFDRNGVPVAKFGNSAKPEEIEAAIDKVL